MNSRIDIFMFIDAMGWEIIKDRDFLTDLLPYRRPVKMQFGYSSTAIPTILTGEPPVVHKHLSFYYYSPESSPFTIFHKLMLHKLPKSILSRWRFRHILSKAVAKFNGYTGYFEMYAMPFDKIHYFDYIEKKDIFVPGGLAPVPNLADMLVEKKIPYHISNWRLSEEENVAALTRDIEKGDIRFAFLYTAAMDGLLHMVTKSGKEVGPKLEWYASKIRKIAEVAGKHYKDFSISVVSDHGMTTKTGVVDVMKAVDSLGLQHGKDYAATYDSTMGRFWFLDDNARTAITKLTAEIPHSKIVSQDEKRKYGIDFHDNMYGEMILLMDPGYQIEPCDMGLKALPGMHGYSPEHEDSNATFLSTDNPEPHPEWVGDYFKIMMNRLGK
jgi:hypothetical protein